MQKVKTNLNRVAMKLEKVLNDNNQSKTKNPDWGMKLKSEKSGVEIVEQKQ